MPPVFSAKSLTKKFSSLTAVDNVSFDLKPTEILGLLGPNGAGKTTTIQMLLGVLTPTSGEVELFGKSLIQNRSEALEKVNFSSTYTNLPWNLTVSDNLNFISYLYEIPDRKQRLRELIEIFSLAALLDKRVVLLSAGELTRLNLAKAFINSPQVVLLDEPTASLDPESSNLIQSFILEQREQKGVSVLFTSHNMAEVEKLCDRVIFIDHGKVIADDTPARLAKRFNISSLVLNVESSSQADFLALCADFECQGSFISNEYSGKIVEDKIPALLAQLSLRNIKYSHITIERPGLEEFFLNRNELSWPESVKR